MPPSLFCPGCGEGVSAEMSFCPSCSTALPKRAPDYPSPQTDAAQATGQYGTPYGWMESGEPPRPVVPLRPQVPAYQPPVAQAVHSNCPGCGFTPPPVALFCPQCGRGLRAAPPQGFYAPQAFAATPAATLSFAQRSVGEQLLIIILAVVAACVILAFFC